MIKNKKSYLLYIGIVLLVMSCAKIVTPTGGPKDVTPPEIKSSLPENYSTRFKTNEVKITFDEFIQLKELNKRLIISPPLSEKPIIRVKGKTLIIRFETELRDSTTYNIYFGEALQDFNEGNPYKNFQYVLSTGDFIDSLAITGKVLNSFNLAPVEDVYVMLYSDLADSVPYKQIPEYLSKTDKTGIFRINNIRNDTYKVFALKDGNNNYRFDVNSEEIGFIDSLITFKMESVTKIDTLFKNSNNSINQSDLNNDLKKKSSFIKVIDTIITYSVIEYPVKNYTLLLFTEDFEPQYLKNTKRDEKNKLDIILNKPIKDSLIINFLDNPATRFIKEYNAQKDTFIYWLKDTVDYNKPEILCTISYQKLDSTKHYTWKTDTLKMRYIDIKKPKKGEQIIEEKTKLNISMNLKDRSTFDLNKQIRLTTKAPIENIDTTKINLYSIIDSVETIIPIILRPEKNNLREFLFVNNYQENTNYRLEIYPSAFYDIYGNQNDTIITYFKTQKLDFYGKLLVNIKGLNPEENIIVQLITAGKKGEELITKKQINKDQIVEFEFLPPKEFMVKLVFDKNNNGKWDTGNYLTKVQPEPVVYYEKAVNIRSNWDVEISIDLTKRK